MPRARSAGTTAASYPGFEGLIDCRVPNPERAPRMRMIWPVVVLAALVGDAAAQDRLPRTPLPKRAVAPSAPSALLPGTLATEHQLAVKFIDAARVRARADGGLVALGAADLTAVEALRARFGLSFVPHILTPPSVLAALEERAALRTGRAQADLAGILRVRVPQGGAAQLAAAGNALLALDVVEFVSLSVQGAPPPGDVTPFTPDFSALQAYRNAGAGLDFAAAHALGLTGAGIRFSDCEYGWRPNHEDLIDTNLHLEPGQTPNPQVGSLGWNEHGTAVVGVHVSGDNGYGCTGMAPGAAVYTFPEWTVQDGFRDVTCVANAIAASAAGDVVLLEMQSGEGAPRETNPAMFLVVQTGTSAGVVVVAAAGNGGQDLDAGSYAAWSALDSGAIIVGAGSANGAHDKLSFSSFGQRVNVQTWGESVATLGYGDLAQVGGDKKQRYTAGFNGTSSASALAAPACVVLQELAVRQMGKPLAPAALRQLLITSGKPQGAGAHIGPCIDLGRAMQYLLPWKNLGQAQAGVAGIPELAGEGTLEPGSSIAIRATGAAPLAPMTLIIGASALDAPFKGGVLVPQPDLLLFGQNSAAGAFTLIGTLPAILPAGFTFYMQQWTVDATAPQGVSASNALSGTIPS